MTRLSLPTLLFVRVTGKLVRESGPRRAVEETHGGIRRYTPADEPGLYDLIRSEGNEWRGYWSRWTACVQAMDRCEVFVVRKRSV
jgi:hypothetical protein